MAKRGGKGGSSSEFNAAAGNQPVEAEFRPGSGYVHPVTGIILSGQEIDAARKPGGSDGVIISENNRPTLGPDYAGALTAGADARGLTRLNPGTGQVKRVPAGEKATVKGQRAEQTATGTIKTKDFRAMLDLHSNVIGAALRQLHAVAARGDRPGRLSPLGQSEDSILHNLAHKRLNSAEGHFANAKFSMQLGDDYNKGTNLTGRNISNTQNVWDAHDEYHKALTSILNAHDELHRDGTIASVISSNNGTMPHTFTEDQVKVARNALDMLPRKKKGNIPNSVQVGKKIPLRQIQEALRQTGVAEGSDEWNHHMNEARQGNVRRGGPLHQLMINRANGNRSLITRVNRLFAPVSRMTAGKRRNRRAELGLGKGQRVGSSREMASKVMDDVKTVFDNANASGTKLNQTLDQFLEAGAPQVGRREDPKKEKPKKGSGTLSAERIPGPKIGFNVADDIERPTFRPTDTVRQTNPQGEEISVSMADKPLGPEEPRTSDVTLPAAEPKKGKGKK